MAHRRDASQFGAGAPSTVIAEFTGQMYYDTVGNESYIAKSKTPGDWKLIGAGNMSTSVYDTDEDNLVDNAEQLNDGTNIVTALEIRNHLDNLPDVQKDDVDIVSSFSKLNFEGGFTVVNSGSGKATISLDSISDDLASVHIRRTTDLTGSTTFADIVFDTTDVQNDSSVVEHDTTNTDRVLIKETGLYLLGYSCEISPTGYPSVLQGRVRINDTAVVPQSTVYVEEDQEITNFNAIFLVELTAGDYVTVQIQTSIGSETIQTGMGFFVIRQKGSKGEKGDSGTPGAGSTVVIEENDVAIPNTPHSVLNFANGFSVSDEGAGQAKIQPPVFGTEAQVFEDLPVIVSTSTSFVNKLDVDTTNLPAGTYKVEWHYGWNHDNTGNDFEARLVLDNDTAINNLVMIHRQEVKDSGGSGSGRYFSTSTNQNYVSSGFRVLSLSGIHNFKLDFRTTSSGDESAIWDVTLLIHRIT